MRKQMKKKSGTSMELSISERQYSFFIFSSHSCLVFRCLQRAYTHINYLFAANSNSVRQAHRARHIIPLPQSCILLTPGPVFLSPKEMTGSLGLTADKFFAVVVTIWRRETGEHETQERNWAGWGWGTLACWDSSQSRARRAWRWVICSFTRETKQKLREESL